MALTHILDHRGFDEDDDAFDYDIEHPDECPLTQWNWGPDYGCDVAMLLSDMGSDAFSPPLECVSPGRYMLDVTVEYHRHFEGTEVELWLQVGAPVASIL